MRADPHCVCVRSCRSCWVCVCSSTLFQKPCLPYLTSDETLVSASPIPATRRQSHNVLNTDFRRSTFFDTMIPTSMPYFYSILPPKSNPTFRRKVWRESFSRDVKGDGVTITHAEAIWILGTFRTSIIVND